MTYKRKHDLSVLPQLIIAANRLLGTFRDLWVLTDASTQWQGDVREVTSRVGQTLGAAVCRRAANGLGRLGSRPPPCLDPVFRNLLRLTENTDTRSSFTQQESLSCTNSAAIFICSQWCQFCSLLLWFCLQVGLCICTFLGSTGQQHQVQVHSGHPGKCLQVPDVGSSSSHLYESKSRESKSEIAVFIFFNFLFF